MGNRVDRLGGARKVETRFQTAGKAVLLILLLIQVFHAQPEPPSLSLRYDDGGAECFWSDYYPNGIAARFAPPASLLRITSILIYGFAIDKGEKTFTVEVRDSSFNLVFRSSYPVSKYFKNATLDWARLPLPNILVKGHFYVCVYPMLEPNATQLWIAIDMDTVSGRSFLLDCYEERLSKYEAGSVMIRVEADETARFTEIIADSISVKEEGLELTFRVIPPANVTKVEAILQKGSTMEECKVMLEDGFYRVAVRWPEFSGLTEPARLMLSVKTLNSTATLAIRLSETFFSTHLKLVEENRFLKPVLNSSKLEQETLRRILEDKEADATVLRASLEAYEKKWLKKVEEAAKLTRELHVTRLLTMLLGVSTALLSIFLLRRKTRAGSASKRWGG